MENTNTNSTIQKLTKVGKVLSKIIFVCCIVGVAGCLIGIVFTKVAGEMNIKIGGLTIHNIIEKNAEMSMGTLYTTMACAMIICIGELIISGLANKFFELELSVGTYFDFKVADEMKKLGIKIIIVSFVTAVVYSITFAIMLHFLCDVSDLHMNDYVSIGSGIAFLVISLLCKNGAEIRIEKNTI